METRTVTYYQLLSDINFSDGFSIKAGAVAMLISDLDDDMINLQIEDHAVKRIFWIEKANVKLKGTKKERWTKAQIIQHDIDVNEKWLDKDKNKKNEQKNIGVKKTTGSSKSKTNRATVLTNRTVGKGGKKTTARGGRSIQSVKQEKKAGTGKSKTVTGRTKKKTTKR